jgi:hypothetical protein
MEIEREGKGGRAGEKEGIDNTGCCGGATIGDAPWTTPPPYKDLQAAATAAKQLGRR